MLVCSVLVQENETYQCFLEFSFLENVTYKFCYLEFRKVRKKRYKHIEAVAINTIRREQSRIIKKVEFIIYITYIKLVLCQ